MATMEAEVTALVNNLESDLVYAERAACDASHELQSVEQTVSFAKKKVKDLRSTADINKGKIAVALKDADTEATTVPDAITESELELHKRQEWHEAVYKFYDALLKRAQRNHIFMGWTALSSATSCPISSATFVKNRKERLAAKQQQLEEDARHWEKPLADLKKLVPLEDRLRDLRALKKMAVDVMRRHREREDYAREIAKLESELSTINSTATPEEIQAQLSDLSEQIRVIKAAMEKIRVEQQTATITLARKKQELKDKEALEQRQIEACEDVARLEKESKDLDKQLQADDKSAEQLHHNKREICGYETRGGDNKLSKCEPKLKQHDAVIANTEQRIAQLQGQISQIDQTLADSEAVLRNLQDNIRLRTEKRQLESVTQQIKDLDEDSACKACRKFENKYNKRRRKQTDLQLFSPRCQARLGGETNTMKNDELDKGEELETEYKDIEEKYRCELINVKTARMSNQDLEKLQKEGTRWMEEINDTTAELWTKTYQGTDIAEVMIKSDADGKTTGTAHSYNYR
ncbi:hypothetical protein JCM10213_007109 [Rhodosporidiobolus nylandii]